MDFCKIGGMHFKRMITFFFVIVPVTLAWAQEKPPALFETGEGKKGARPEIHSKRSKGQVCIEET
jgi:hypothetical protein